MPPSNPLTAMDDIVANAVIGHTLFADLAGAGRIQVFGNVLDIRGEIQESAHIGKRVWIEPEPSDMQWNFSSGTTRLVMNWIVGCGNGNMQLQDVRALSYDLMLVLGLLAELKNSDGSQLNDAATTPFKIQTITVGGSRPELDPLSQPREWRDEIPVSAELFAPTSALSA